MVDYKAMVEISMADREMFLAENDLEKINKMALSWGYLITDEEAHRNRKDYSYSLGKKLSMREEKCYRLIDTLSYLEGPVGLKEIYEIFYEGNYDRDLCEGLIWTLINRARAKLGSNSIIAKTKLGYISRRAIIDVQVARNKQTNVPPAGIELASLP